MRIKILLISQLVITLILAAFSVLSSWLFYQTLTKEKTSELKVQAAFFDESYTLDEMGVKSFSEKLGGARVTLIALDGTVVADSSSKSKENHLGREEVKEELSSGEGIAVRKSSTLDKEYLYYCVKAAVNGEELLVRLSVTTDTLAALLLSTLPTL